MRIGFTGTRDGLTPDQAFSLGEQFDLIEGAFELHHGCCLGADEEAHWLADSWNLPIVGHPPVDRRLMMDMDRRVLHTFNLMRDPKPYLDRNRDIVDQTDRLIATPKQGSVALSKGGTFYTIRYALKQGKPVTIIWPDGEVDVRSSRVD